LFLSWESDGVEDSIGLKKVDDETSNVARHRLTPKTLDSTAPFAIKHRWIDNGTFIIDLAR
jgi:hypothetical protein